jgi:cell division protein FtsQ
LVAGGRQVAVAPDGTVLEGTKTSGSLPTIDVGGLPAGARMPDGPARDRVAVAAAAPPRLLARVDAITVQHGRGVVAELKAGPVVIFGRAEALERKWAAATAVLAQRTSQGATYIDVRMPQRPVAGGLDLTQDPQAQPEAAAPGTVAGSPGVLPAVPPAAAGTTPAPAYGAPTGSTDSPQTTAPSGTTAAPTTASPAPTEAQP